MNSDIAYRFGAMEAMLKEGFAQEEIARGLGISLSVSEDYMLLNENPDIMNIVLDGHVGVEFALLTLKRHPERALSILKKAALLKNRKG